MDQVNKLNIEALFLNQYYVPETIFHKIQQPVDQVDRHHFDINNQCQILRLNLRCVHVSINVHICCKAKKGGKKHLINIGKKSNNYKRQQWTIQFCNILSWKCILLVWKSLDTKQIKHIYVRRCLCLSWQSNLIVVSMIFKQLTPNKLIKPESFQSISKLTNFSQFETIT